MNKLYTHLHIVTGNLKKLLLYIGLLLLILLISNRSNAQCDVNPVANRMVCNNNLTTAINFTGTATTFSWVNNNTAIGLAASGTGNIPSFTALNATAAAITATITVTPSNGACTGTPISFTITVNPLPVVIVTRNTTCGGPCNFMTANGADVYVWTPTTGLFTDCGLTQAYTGTNISTVYTAPGTTTTYTVTGTSLATGCIKAATVIPNYVPPTPVIIPPSASMCLGDPGVKLKVAGGNGFSQFCSGPINIPVPDNNPAGAFSSINVAAGIPASCSITGIIVTINMQHTRIGNMVFVLKAPNASVLNLDYHLSTTGGTASSTGFTNTVISSIATTALSAGTNPYTGTFKADAQNLPTGGFGACGPTGMLPTINNWAGMTPTSGAANGTWTLGFYDGVTGDVGTLTSWCIRFQYSCPATAATPAIWSPIAGLFYEPAAIAPYNGVQTDSVWARPTPAGVYPYQVVNFTSPMPPVAFSNPSAISIPVGGTASPYSSNIGVYGLPASGITVKSVVLNNISHTRPVDIDIVLQSPSGQNVILMSDAGSSNTVNATYTFVNGVAPDLNSLLPNPTGNYKPTNIGVPDNFPAPGPGNISQVSPALSQFTGNMNGTWKLFVMDDDGTANQGTISGGFTINFDLGAPACPSPPATVIVTVGQSFTITQYPSSQVICEGGTTNFTVGVSGSGPFTYQWQLNANGSGYTNLVNGGVYSGVNTNTLTISNATTGMNSGLYRVLISGGAATCASGFTPAVSLTVRPLPTITITANPLIIGPTQTSTITSTVTPNPAATYTWYYNNALIPGAVSSSLLVNYGSPGDYQLKVTDVNGCTNFSNIITIANSFALNMYTYPNPSGGIFQVRYRSEFNNTLQRSLTVYNNRGEKILTQNFTQTIPYQKIDVDVRRHGKGLYWVEVRDANGNRLGLQRVVVQ